MAKLDSVIGKVELTDERKQHIQEHHPDMVAQFPKLETVLTQPDEIRVDNNDAQVLLFYKHFSNINSGKYLVAVVKVNARNFILTFYSTHRVKTGEKYEF